MLLTTPPTTIVLQTQPQEKRVLAKIALTYLRTPALLELMSAPELASLLLEDGMPGKPLPLLRPARLDNILFSPADHTVITQGTPEAQEQFKALLKLLDVKPQGVLLTMRLVQGGKPESRPTISTFSNAKGWMAVGDTTDLQMVTVIPHLNRDGKTVAVAAKVNDEKWLVQTVKLGADVKFVFPNNQTLFVTATRP